MLILAGVSISAIVGDDGLITKAQDAVYAQSLAFLQEQMNLDYVNKYASNELATLEAYIRDGWVKRVLTSGEGQINIKYIFIKSNLNEEWQKSIVGGEGVAETLINVYGINSDLSCWYIDNDGNVLGAEPEVMALDENMHLEFSENSFGEAISTMTGKTSEEVTVSDIQDITSLSLSNITAESLDDLYYFPNLKTLSLSNVKVKNCNGFVYLQQLLTLNIYDGTEIEDWTGASGLSRLTTFDIRTMNDSNQEKICRAIGKINTLKYFYPRYCAGLTHVKSFALMENKLNEMTIYFDGDTNLKSYEGLEGWTNLYRLDHVNAYSVTNISALSGKNNLYRIQFTSNAKNVDMSFIANLQGLTNIDFNNTTISSAKPISDCYKNHAITNIYLPNTTITDESTISLLQQAYNAGHITAIKENYKNYLTTTQVALQNSNISDLNVLSNYSTSITQLKLSGNSQITDTSMEYFKTHSYNNLQILWLDNTGISSLTWLKKSDGTCVFPELRQISIYNCDNVTSLSGLESATKLTHLDITYCDGITASSFVNTSGGSTTYYYPSSIVYLYAYGCSKLISLSGLSNMKNLNWANFDRTPITGNNASALNDLSNLKYLYIGSNGTDAQNINISSIMPTINRSYNGYIGFQANNNKSLVQQCNNEQLTHLRLDTGTEAYSITRSATSNDAYYLTLLDLSNAVNMKYFRSSNNYIQGVTLPKNSSALTTVIMEQMWQGKKFNMPDFSGITNISTISMQSNYLTKDDFNNLCTQLEGKMNISSIDLYNNSISKIENIAKIGSINSSKNITLNLSNNIISNLNGIENLNNNITSLNLANNQISNITPLITLAQNNVNKKLTAITLTGNNISDADIQTLRNYYTVNY